MWGVPAADGGLGLGCAGGRGRVGAARRCKAAAAAAASHYWQAGEQATAVPTSLCGHRFGFGPLGSPGTALLPLGSASSCTSSSTARLALHMLTRPETRGEPGNKDEMADAACKCAGAIGLSNPGRQLPCLLASPSNLLCTLRAAYRAHDTKLTACVMCTTSNEKRVMFGALRSYKARQFPPPRYCACSCCCSAPPVLYSARPGKGCKQIRPAVDVCPCWFANTSEPLRICIPPAVPPPNHPAPPQTRRKRTLFELPQVLVGPPQVLHRNLAQHLLQVLRGLVRVLLHLREAPARLLLKQPALTSGGRWGAGWVACEGCKQGVVSA